MSHYPLYILNRTTVSVTITIVIISTVDISVSLYSLRSIFFLKELGSSILKDLPCLRFQITEVLMVSEESQETT